MQNSYLLGLLIASAGAACSGSPAGGTGATTSSLAASAASGGHETTSASSTGASSSTGGATTGGGSGTTSGASGSSTTGVSSGGTGGCATTVSDATLPSAPTWCNYAQAFVSTYCLGCHQPGGQASAVDFGSLANVASHDTDIRCGVCVPQAGSSAVCEGAQTSWNCSNSPASPGQFPIGSGPHPTDAQRTALVSWVSAGSPP